MGSCCSGRVTTRLPGPLVATAPTTAAAKLLTSRRDECSRFGSVPTPLPMPHLPQIDWGRLRRSIARDLDRAARWHRVRMLLRARGRRHDGAAPPLERRSCSRRRRNLAVPLSRIPATGAIASHRHQREERRPHAGRRHRPRAHAAPDPASSRGSGGARPDGDARGILLVVAYNMSEWRVLRKRPAARLEERRRRARS
jgi:hypothetical protein